MRLFVDEKKCVGCRLCELACTYSSYKEFNPSRSRIKVFRFRKEGRDVPVVCRQCAKCLCIEVCPTKALKKNDKTKVVIIDEDLCIGCRKCLTVCPFGGIMVDPVKETAIACNLCEGDPECVKYCVTKALSFVPNTEISARATERVGSNE